jgi:GNAT superfamily N-acetyltransferase
MTIVFWFSRIIASGNASKQLLSIAMKKILTRKAVAGDLDVLLTFEQGVIYTERPLDPTLREGVIHYYDLKNMLADENVQLVVAELEGELVGSGYARIEQSKPYLKHHRHAYLGFMYVHPGFRGKGVNGAIIEALKEWALTKNISELRLDVYVENEQAIHAYEKAGFRRHLLEMRMGIGEGQATPSAPINPTAATTAKPPGRKKK